MDFQWPAMLWLLVLVPAFIAAYLWAQRRQQRYAIRYASLVVLKEALGKGSGIRRHVPPFLFLLGLTAMIIALARPSAVVSVPFEEATIILTMDTSGSMAADDISPTRLEAAQAAARTFVQHEPKGVRIGVVSFSDNASVVQSPTTDQDSVIAAVNRLYPQQGTAIGRALEASMDAAFDVPASDNPNPFATSTPSADPSPTSVLQGQSVPPIVILLTDGENNEEPDPADVIGELADRGVRVYTVGIGSPQGSVVQAAGVSVNTRLDEDTLKQIAEASDGAYYNAMDADELQTIYSELDSHLGIKSEKTEVTAGLTGIAAACCTIAGILSFIMSSHLP